MVFKPEPRLQGPGWCWPCLAGGCDHHPEGLPAYHEQQAITVADGMALCEDCAHGKIMRLITDATVNMGHEAERPPRDFRLCRHCPRGEGHNSPAYDGPLRSLVQDHGGQPAARRLCWACAPDEGCNDPMRGTPVMHDTGEPIGGPG